MSASISGLETPGQVRGLDLAGQEPAQKSADSAVNDRDGFNLPVQKKSNLEIRWYPPDHEHLVIGLIPRQQHCSATCGELSVWNVGSTSKPHIAIQVLVTCEQEKALQRFIDSTAKERAMPMDTCAGSSAYILRQHTDLQIPRIVASFPACSISYLLFQKMLGNRKIGEVEFRGGMGNCNCLRSRVSLLIFPVAFLGEAFGLLIFGLNGIHAINKGIALSDPNRLISRLFSPAQVASDFINLHLEYFAEVKAGDLDFRKTAALLFALFGVVMLCTALTSILIGSVRKNLFHK